MTYDSKESTELNAWCMIGTNVGAVVIFIFKGILDRIGKIRLTVISCIGGAIGLATPLYLALVPEYYVEGDAGPLYRVWRHRGGDDDHRQVRKGQRHKGIAGRKDLRGAVPVYIYETTSRAYSSPFFCQ
jgi:hypothetical protein